MELGFSRQILEIYSDIKFYGNPSIGLRVFSRGRTNGRRDRRTHKHDLVLSSFSQFCKHAKKKTLHFSRK
jgi:hypothetical protein